MGASEMQTEAGKYDATLEDSFPASDPPPGVIALGPPRARRPRKEVSREGGDPDQRGPARPTSI